MKYELVNLSLNLQSFSNLGNESELYLTLNPINCLFCLNIEKADKFWSLQKSISCANLQLLKVFNLSFFFEIKQKYLTFTSLNSSYRKEISKVIELNGNYVYTSKSKRFHISKWLWHHRFTKCQLKDMTLKFAYLPNGARFFSFFQIVIIR